jgi:hypothetical protein
MWIFLSSQSKLSDNTYTFVNTCLKFWTISLGETTTFYLDTFHNFSMEQNMHQFLFLQVCEWILSLKHGSNAGVYKIICNTALKKQVFPKFCNPEPMVLVLISNW